MKNWGIYCILRICLFGFPAIVLFCGFLSCRHADRYEYQQIKQAYENQKPAAVIALPVPNHPVETLEMVMAAAGSLTLEK